MKKLELTFNECSLLYRLLDEVKEVREDKKAYHGRYFKLNVPEQLEVVSIQAKLLETTKPQ